MKHSEMKYIMNNTPNENATAEEMMEEYYLSKHNVNGYPCQDYDLTSNEKMRLIQDMLADKTIENDDKKLLVNHYTECEYDALVEWINKHTKYFSMKQICFVAGIDYYRYTNWNLSKVTLKIEELRKLKATMKGVVAD